MNYEGEIKDIKLVERLIELWRETFTGAIRFENDGIIKIIYFKGGDILSASTNDRADSVDEILMRANKVSKEHVKQALARRKENETLGDALLGLGFITRKELTWARRIQVINVVRSIEAWEAGSFTVVADYLPKREEGTIFPLPQLIVEMIVTDQDRGKFERALESGTVVFTRSAGHEETFRKLGLNEDAEAVMAQVDGERAASDVAAASHQETFNAFKLLHALSLLGILEQKKSGAAAASMGFESAGVADAADVWGSGGTQFNLDDEPAAPAVPVSDDLAPLPGLTDPSVAAEPSWDSPSPPPPPPPPPPGDHFEPPADLLHIEPEEDPKWGFDEGLLAAAPTAAAPPPPPVAPVLPAGRLPRPQKMGEGTMSRRPPIGEGTSTRRAAAPPPKKRDRFGVIVTALAVLAVAALGYYGFTWWQSREAAVVAGVPTPAAAVTETTATATVAPPVTATVAPPEVAAAPVTATVAARPVAPAAGDRGAFESMAREFAADRSGSFTVQFAIVCEPSNVTKALRGSGGSEVWFAPISIKGRSCFRMFWGRFASREAAERAMAGIPGVLRESQPSVVSIPR